MLKTTSICFAKITSCRSGRRWLRELVSSCSRGRKGGVFERHIVCSHKAAGEGGGDNGGVKKECHCQLENQVQQTLSMETTEMEVANTAQQLNKTHTHTTVVYRRLVVLLNIINGDCDL